MSDEDDPRRIRFVFTGRIEELSDRRLAELEIETRILLFRIQLERQYRLAKKGKYTMMSYYPPMAGEDDSVPAGVQLCDVDRNGNLVRCRPYGGASHGWEFDGSSGFGDDAAPAGVQLCDVDRNGNLVRCRPYGDASHGSEFGSHAGGGGGVAHAPAPPTAPRLVAGSLPIAQSSTTRAVQAAMASVPGGSPAQRAAVSASAAHAARAGVQQIPRTTRDFADRQRQSYGQAFRPRGWGYGGYGLAPRAWNDPYYDGVGLIDDPISPWITEDNMDSQDDSDDDFGAEPPWLAEAKHEVQTHKPVVLGATLAAGVGYALGPVGAVAGGVGGYLIGRLFGW